MNFGILNQSKDTRGFAPYYEKTEEHYLKGMIEDESYGKNKT